MFVRLTTYITPSLPPPTMRFVFGISTGFWMPRSSSVALRNDQLYGVNQSSRVPVGVILRKLFPKFLPPTSPLNEPLPVMTYRLPVESAARPPPDCQTPPRPPSGVVL